ncbi:MAG: hypothetical protein ACP5U2_16100 [Bryobacteraceae bacterium]
MRSVAVVALLAVLPAARANLASVLAERNLEKRSRKALENADRALATARQAYLQGQLDATRAALQEVRDSVELACRSLKETGKDPLRHPKHFKHAEIKTRELLKHLRQFRDRMAYDDRPLVEPVLASLDAIHEELLLSIMGKKK